MDLDQIAKTLSMTMGAAWASGINLYAAILVLGLLGVTENIVLPENLHILMNPIVIGAAGVMYVVEFFADKIPGIDTGWDTVHTFIRIPAGVLMAAGAVGDVNPALAVAAGILGGGMAAGAHATKSGSRVLINASPEPFTNWTASVAEDVAVFGGLWAALHYPWLFLGLLVIFIILMIWLLPKIWRGIKKVFGFIGRLLGLVEEEEASESPGEGESVAVGAGSPLADDGIAVKMQTLKDLLDRGLIDEEEFQRKKKELLDGY